MRLALLVLAGLVAVSPPIPAGETVWIELANGSRLRVEWTGGELALETGSGPTPIDPASVERIVPGRWYDEEFLAGLEAALADLGAGEYAVRDAATRTLVEAGRLVQPRLEAMRDDPDPEVAARAAQILERIARGEGGRLPPPSPDRVEAGGRTHEGRLRPAELSFRWRGADRTAPWSQVVSLGREPARPEPAEVRPAEFRRLERTDFLPADRVVDFDRDPAGQAIAAGSNVELSYRDWGLVLDTEVETSIVHADRYVVDSGSKGNSGATQNPVWQGDVRLDLYLPGTIDDATRRGVPAGVHRIGVYVAHVVPGGTGLRAYSSDGRVLREVLSDDTGTDFLGLASPVPIHRVEIFDVPALDPNFTTDDFVLGPLVALEGDLDRFVVEIEGGERVACLAVAGDAGRLRLRPLDEAEPVDVPIASIVSVRPPARRLALGREGGLVSLGPGDRVVAWREDAVVVEAGGESRTIPWEVILVVRITE